MKWIGLAMAVGAIILAALPVTAADREADKARASQTQPSVQQLDCVANAALTLGGVRNLENAETKNRRLDPIVQW